MSSQELEEIRNLNLCEREYLCERLCKMKPLSFEGSTNPLDTEEWISIMETILDFMELNNDEKIICAAYVLRKEVRY